MCQFQGVSGFGLGAGFGLGGGGGGGMQYRVIEGVGLCVALQENDRSANCRTNPSAYFTHPGSLIIIRLDSC